MNPLRTLMYTNRPLAAISLALASAIAPALAVPLTLPAPTTPPTAAYSRDLTATGLTQATLEAEGWTVDRGTIGFVSGTEGLRILPATPYGQTSFRYIHPAAVNVLYVDFEFRPVAGAEQTAELVDGSGAVIGFIQVSTQGEISILHGRPAISGQPGGGQWIKTGLQLLVSLATKTSDNWVRLTIRQDYVRGEWDLYLAHTPSGAMPESKVVTARIGFWEGLPENAPNRLTFIGNTAEPLRIRRVALSYHNTLFADADNDGMKDSWETANGGNATVDDRDVLGSNGLTRLELYLADAANVASAAPTTEEAAAKRVVLWASADVVKTTVPEIGKDLSGITWRGDTGTFFAVQNSSSFGLPPRITAASTESAVVKERSRLHAAPKSVFELSPQGQVIRRIAMSSAMPFADPESICWLSGDYFAIADEFERQIVKVCISNVPFAPRIEKPLPGTPTATNSTLQLIPDDTVSGPRQALVNTALTARDNYGLEGVAWDADPDPAVTGEPGCYYGVIEGNGSTAAPPLVVRINAATGKTRELFQLPALGTLQLADLSEVAYDAGTQLVYLLSHVSRRVVAFRRDGMPVKVMNLNQGSDVIFNPSAPVEDPEGLAVFPHEIVVVAEPAVMAHYRLSQRTRRVGLEATLVISEWMAVNQNTLKDETQRYPDWLEIANNGTAAVELRDYYLTDDAALPLKWQFPVRTLNPGERLVVYASSAPARGPFHTNFKISSAAGGYLALHRKLTADPSPVHVDSYTGATYPTQLPDVSYGRGGNGAGGNPVGFFAVATPALTNGTAVNPAPAPRLPAPVISVAEYSSSGSDIVLTTLPDAQGNLHLESDQCLRLGPEIAGTQILYTLDGSEPYPENSQALVYAEPWSYTTWDYLRVAGRQSIGVRASRVPLSGTPGLPSLAAGRSALAANADMLPWQTSSSVYPYYFGSLNEQTDRRHWSSSLHSAMLPPYFELPAEELPATPSIAALVNESYKLRYDADNLVWPATRTAAQFESLAAQLLYGDATAMPPVAVPTVCITADPQDLFSLPDGIYANSSYRLDPRRMLVEIFNPGATGADRYRAVYAGVKMTGNSTRYHRMTPKHSFRLDFSGRYGGEKLQIASLFPARPGEMAVAGTFDKLNLRNPTQDSWTYTGGWNDGVGGTTGFDGAGMRERAKYITDSWLNHHMARMGHPAYHRRFVHVFLNGLFWGAYELTERVDQDFLASYGQGAGDVLTSDPEPTLVAEAGTLTAWSALRTAATTVSAAGVAASTQAQRDAVDAQYTTLILPQVDATNLIDYMLLNIWAQSEDWPHHNYLVVRWSAPGDPVGGKFRFMNWDSEISLKRSASHARGIGAFSISTRMNDGPGWLFAKLRSVPAFRAAVSARAAVLTGSTGALSPEVVLTSWQGMAAEFSPLVELETMRWGHLFPDSRPGSVGNWVRSDWEAEVNAVANAASLSTSFAGQRNAHFLIYVETLLSAPTNPGLEDPRPPGTTQPVATFRNDLDRDGMPDVWELLNGLNHLLPDVLNIIEMMRGSNPNAASSVGQGSPYSTSDPTAEVFTPLLKF
jgi:uncharacterized protein YjiK